MPRRTWRSCAWPAFAKGFAVRLGLGPSSRVVVHASLPALGPVRGGVETVVGALTTQCGQVVLPAFTPPCRVWPRVGPPHNAVSYSGHDEDDANAEISRPDLPVDPALGPVAEALRHVSGAVRSPHPLYSFTVVGSAAGLATSAQSLALPFGPLAHLAESGRDADVLLLGADHAASVAVHFAEGRAGRKQFVRWALTPPGVVECLGCPGCPDGFSALTPYVQSYSQVVQIGAARVERPPLNELLRTIETLIRRDPTALLCSRTGCERCGVVRTVLAAVASVAPAQPFVPG